jgi:hypothetical protein
MVGPITSRTQYDSVRNIEVIKNKCVDSDKDGTIQTCN